MEFFWDHWDEGGASLYYCVCLNLPYFSVNVCVSHSVNTFSTLSIYSQEQRQKLSWDWCHSINVYSRFQWPLTLPLPSFMCRQTVCCDRPCIYAQTAGEAFSLVGATELPSAVAGQIFMRRRRRTWTSSQNLLPQLPLQLLISHPGACLWGFSPLRLGLNHHWLLTQVWKPLFPLAWIALKGLVEMY